MPRFAASAVYAALFFCLCVCQAEGRMPASSRVSAHLPQQRLVEQPVARPKKFAMSSALEHADSDDKSKLGAPQDTTAHFAGGNRLSEELRQPTVDINALDVDRNSGCSSAENGMTMDVDAVDGCPDGWKNDNAKVQVSTNIHGWFYEHQRLDFIVGNECYGSQLVTKKGLSQGTMDGAIITLFKNQEVADSRCQECQGFAFQTTKHLMCNAYEAAYKQWADEGPYCVGISCKHTCQEFVQYLKEKMHVDPGYLREKEQYLKVQMHVDDGYLREREIPPLDDKAKEAQDRGCECIVQ